MSYALYFLDHAFVGDWHAGMEALEASTLKAPAWSDADEAAWASIIESLPEGMFPSDPQTTVPREIEHPGNGVRLIAHPRQISFDIHYSSGPAAELTEMLTSAVAAVEAATGLVAFDPQANGGFLDAETGTADAPPTPVASARAQTAMTRLIRHPGDLWMDRGAMLALTKDELKVLRSTKGDRARRARAAGLELEVSGSRLLQLGEEWSFLNNLCAEPLGGLAVFVGQRMHKGDGHSITLLKDVEAQVAFMDGYSADDIAALTAGLSDETIRYRTPFWVSNDWDEAGISDIATPERAARTGRLWVRLREFLRTSLDEGTAPLFVCDHRRSGRKHFG